MLRDGLIQARKGPGKGRDGRWHIPVSEVERFKKLERVDQTQQERPATPSAPWENPAARTGWGQPAEE